MICCAYSPPLGRRVAYSVDPSLLSRTTVEISIPLGFPHAAALSAATRTLRTQSGRALTQRRIPICVRPDPRFAHSFRLESLRREAFSSGLSLRHSIVPLRPIRAGASFLPWSSCLVRCRFPLLVLTGDHPEIAGYPGCPVGKRLGLTEKHLGSPRPSPDPTPDASGAGAPVAVFGLGLHFFI